MNHYRMAINVATRRIASNRTLWKEALHVTATVRITAGIYKARDAGRMDTQIGFADALQRVFARTVAS